MSWRTRVTSCSPLASGRHTLAATLPWFPSVRTLLAGPDLFPVHCELPSCRATVVLETLHNLQSPRPPCQALGAPSGLSHFPCQWRRVKGCALTDLAARASRTFPTNRLQSKPCRSRYLLHWLNITSSCAFFRLASPAMVRVHQVTGVVPPESESQPWDVAMWCACVAPAHAAHALLRSECSATKLVRPMEPTYPISDHTSQTTHASPARISRRPRTLPEDIAKTLT